MAIDELKVKQEIETGQNITVNVMRLASSGKESLKYIITEILKKHDALEHFSDIFTTVNELVFNAIKANYKHILIRDNIEKYIIDNKSPHSLKQILANKTLYNAYIKNIDIETINESVKDIFQKEEKASKIIRKAEDENRSLTNEEKAIVETNLNMVLRAQVADIKVFLNFNFEVDNIIIDIINDAPISEDDIERINDKRKKFAQYFKEGREQDFYIENIDTTESAGFGIAMIDARLYALGLEPMKTFNIFGIANKTCLTLTYPINK